MKSLLFSGAVLVLSTLTVTIAYRQEGLAKLFEQKENKVQYQKLFVSENEPTTTTTHSSEELAKVFDEPKIWDDNKKECVLNKKAGEFMCENLLDDISKDRINGPQILLGNYDFYMCLLVR